LEKDKTLSDEFSRHVDQAAPLVPPKLAASVIAEFLLLASVVMLRYANFFKETQDMT
jgi:hypothetical protein